MAERRGSFTSSGQLNSSLQARQVGIDRKPLTGSDKVWADFVGMNDDGTYNEWGRVRNNLLSWFGMGAIQRTMDNVGRNEIMSNKNDDYGRAWRSPQGQAQLEAENSASWNMSIEGGKATGNIIKTAASFGAGSSEGEQPPVDKVQQNFQSEIDKDFAPGGVFYDENADFAVGANNAGVQAGGGDTQYSYLTDAEKKSNPGAGDTALGILSGQGIPKSETGFDADESKLVDVSWANSVPMVGGFIGSIGNYANQNEIMGQTINDYLGNLDRSLSLYENEFAG
jgi:hypothetical protein